MTLRFAPRLFSGLRALFFASEYTERPLLRKTLEHGFEIVDWVMLWHIEVLVFEPIAIKNKIIRFASIDQASDRS